MKIMSLFLGCVCLIVHTHSFAEASNAKPIMWDGVHQLKDGSTVTVKGGVTIENSHESSQRSVVAKPISETEITPVKTESWEGKPIVGDSPCQQLVAKACGPHNECQQDSACALAKQSLALEKTERQKSWGNIEYMTQTSGQCLNSLNDETFFKPCLNQ